jgi:hypothetical protein
MVNFAEIGSHRFPGIRILSLHYYRASVAGGKRLESSNSGLSTLSIVQSH